MHWLIRLAGWFTGCSHKRLSRCFMTRNRFGVVVSSRVLCLSCGSAWYYDWERMRIGKRVRIEPVGAGLGIVGAPVSVSVPVSVTVKCNDDKIHEVKGIKE